MIAFLQLPYRNSAVAAPAAEPAASLKTPLSLAVAQGSRHPQRAMLSYLRLRQIHDPQELGPRVVGITLSLILAAQLALVLWLYVHQGRP